MSVIADLAPWFDGVGSIASAAVAAVVMILGLCQYRAVEQRRRDQHERREASNVTWAMGHPATPLGFVDGSEWATRGYPGQPTNVLTIYNGNSGVIYDVLVQVAEFTPYHELEEHQLDPSFRTRQVGALPPGSFSFTIPVSWSPTQTSHQRSLADVALNLPVEWVEFRDSEEAVWRRHRDGKLARQPDRPPTTGTLHSI